MSLTTAVSRRRWFVRHPLLIFWVCTAPLVFQLTYTVGERNGGQHSPEAMWLAYVLTQLGYVLVVVGMIAVRNAYRSWIDSI